METLVAKLGKEYQLTEEQEIPITLVCVKQTSCKDCHFIDKDCNGVKCWDDEADYMFIKKEDIITSDIETLERIAKEYRGRTIENIIENLKQRQKEAEK